MISVIMPVWNTAPYLQQAIESVLVQTYRDWELILIDDGSTDGSADICEEFARKDCRIRVISLEHKGVSEARNTGLKAAAGDFLQFVDSDDWLYPYALEKLMAKAAETGADMVIFDTQFEAGNASWHDRSPLAEGVYSPEFILAQLALTKIPPFTTNKFSRRDLYSGASFPAGELWEDAGVTFYPVSRAGRIAVFPEPLYHYRQRGDSTTKLAIRDKSSYKWRFLQYRKRYEFLKKEYPPIAEAAKFTVLDSGIKYYTFSLSGDQDRAEKQRVHAFLSGKEFYSRSYSPWNKFRYVFFRFFPDVMALFTRAYMNYLNRRRPH